VSFLSQFVQQSDEISDMDAELFQQYLDGTDGAAEVSGDTMQAFFDHVDGILADTRSLVQQTLAGFFQDVASSFGLSDREAGTLQDTVNDQVAAMFDDVDRFLADARTALAGPAAEPALPEAAPEEALTQAESDPEVA
jgi:hypothetical protein